MAQLSALLLPLALLGVSLAAVARRQDAYSALLAGAGEGLRTLARMLPALLVLLPVVQMLQASGAAERLCKLLQPLARVLGIPAETLPILLVRPLSGSAALAVGADLMARHGPDSPIGRTAAVMLGSTETTFYTVSVYFGAAGVRRTRYAVPAALLADFTGFASAALFTRLLFPS